MKKLLGLTALAAVLVLSACDGSTDETACSIEEIIFGVPAEITVIAQADGDYVTEVEYEVRLNVSELESDEAEELADALDGTIEDGYIVDSQTEDVNNEELSVDEFIESMEADGLNCS